MTFELVLHLKFSTQPAAGVYIVTKTIDVCGSAVQKGIQKVAKQMQPISAP